MPELPEGTVEMLARFKWEAVKGATWDVADPAWKEPWLNAARKQMHELAPQLHKAWADQLLSEEALEAARRAMQLSRISHLSINTQQILIREALQAALQATKPQGDGGGGR